MLFNSYTFIGFFVIVYALYLVLSPRYRLQNGLLLVASYVFYGYWDWRFLSLIAGSTLVDYVVALQLNRASVQSTRRALLIVSVVVNLGLLGFFKYFGFFANSFSDLLNGFGIHADTVTLKVVLPVGISFYTFQSLSYTIDVYRRQLSPTSNFVDFALYVSFFPQLVAGPIERAAHLLPQIQNARKITPSAINAGIYLIVWGYFKKVVVADNLGLVADQIFNQYQRYHGLDLVIGVVAFAFQIYGDFSGYSDIARGLCKLMGFDLMVNFRLPYFASSPREFWRRWHVSLSTWLRDYLFIPLGGSRVDFPTTLRNLFLTMLLGGLWHGAAWHFVIWGAFHGSLLAGQHALNVATGHYALADPRRSLWYWPKVAAMFLATLAGWVFFRGESLEQITYILSNVGFSASQATWANAYKLAFFLVPLLAFDAFQHRRRDLLAPASLPIFARGALYAVLIVAVLVFRVRSGIEFIYFQF